MTATPQSIAAAEARLCEELAGLTASDWATVRVADLRLVLEENTRLTALRNGLARLVREHGHAINGQPERPTIINAVICGSSTPNTTSEQP